MALDPSRYAVSYQANSEEKYPTLYLNSHCKDEGQSSDTPSVAFVNCPPAFERHSSTASSDTQSSNNVLIMSSQAAESSPLRETHRDPFSVPRIIRYMEGVHFIITIMVVFSVSLTIALIVQIYTVPPQVIPHGGITSSSAYCSQLAVKSLKSTSASSVDVAILTALCICITQPHAASVGGGGFALVHNQKIVKDATHVYNFRERSPAAFSNSSFRNDFFEGKLMSEVESNYAIAVPGVLKGLHKLHKDHGKLSWKVIVDQAASIARDGFLVSDDLSAAIEKANISAFTSNLQSLLVFPNGTRLTKGNLLQIPDLANVLENVAVNGANSLYSGNISQKFLEDITDNDGVISKADLLRYEVQDSFDANETHFANFKVVSAGPPSNGFALHSVMKTMALYPHHPDDDPNKFLQVHRMIETIKYSEALQTELGDPSRPNYTAPNFFSSSSLGSTVESKISNSTSALPIQDYLGEYQPLQLMGGGQQYVSLIGPDGFAVLITLSIGSPFGSGIMASGIILNDAMRDFSWTGRSADFPRFRPSQANYLTGNARPMSSLLPVLVIPAVTKCGEYVVPGSIPGDESLSVMVQTLIYDRNRNLQAAINRPRFHYQITSFMLHLENGTDSRLIAFLNNMNHNTTLQEPRSLGALNAVQWYDSVVHSFNDVRSSENASLFF